MRLAQFCPAVCEPHCEIFAYAKTKAQISFAVTVKLISAFVFATRIVLFLFFLNLKFQASSLPLWLHRPVCVGPGWKPKDRFSHMSRLMGKPTICIGENKDADQLRGNREADQRLCFHYSDSTISLLLKSDISSF